MGVLRDKPLRQAQALLRARIQSQRLEKQSPLNRHLGAHWAWASALAVGLHGQPDAGRYGSGGVRRYGNNERHLRQQQQQPGDCRSPDDQSGVGHDGLERVIQQDPLCPRAVHGQVLEEPAGRDSLGQGN